MKKIANLTELTREDWLKMRTKGIGGSDAAAACGLNPWKSKASLYLEKTGQVVKDIDNEILRQGRDLEDYVAKRFTEATGKKVRRNNFMMARKDYPFMFADIDREVVGEDAILECKTTSPYAKDKWADGAIPINYELQCHHYMMVTGAKKCYIACLIFSTDFIIREIERDEEVIQMLEAQEIDFWTNYVEKGEMPAPDGSDEYDQALKDRFKGGLEEGLDLEINKQDYEAYKDRKDLIKTLDADNKEFEQKIKLQLGDHDYGRSEFLQVTYKPVVTTRIDTKRIKKERPEIFEEFSKVTESRRFNLKEIMSE
ncbi:YqaJ viral recombinase family protein [Anaerococcus sp. NML200537]|uniref:YqaJ viral recombinase family nuclease n=1 Tax=Anaerococcus sp. NML200537 TaxID=2954485 RepID=UPI0022390BE1|nr:YqaJ viral recombinase family protein [Anaerococcus sp. NML200537]MCW6701555.1 YqaJ viral recombinase family protein [Anaerococcus sp. NML200537]